jgi:putative spermidine/putrescine transport system ATP-binding protein
VPLHGATSEGGRASLLLRPERIELKAGEHAGSLGGEIRDITFLGTNIHIVVQPSGAAPISVRLPFGHAALDGLSTGARVTMSFNAADTHAFR